MSDQIYREQFMEIFKSNANFGQMDSPTVTADQVNPICGDKMTLQLKIENNKVVDAKFTGVACAVSKTSASIITDEIKGKSLDDLKKLTEQDMLALIKFDLTLSRQQCALLCYHALKKALENYDKK
ncbi:MAG: iron-sulfur cluster assembly scaffold protein [Patescibacteria group bacterium]